MTLAEAPPIKSPLFYGDSRSIITDPGWMEWFDKLLSALATAETPTWDDIEDTPDELHQVFYQSEAPTIADGLIDGDLWFDIDTNYLYRWDGVEWVQIQDVDIIAALEAAQYALVIADGKIETFVGTDEPTASGVGDLWVDTTDNQLYRWSGTAWESIQDTGILSALTTAENAQAVADGKITTFFSPDAPTAEGVGDLWFDTNDKNKVYRWNGTSWILARDTDISQAINDAATAIEMIAGVGGSSDGKVTTFYAASPPTSEGIGDLWIDSSDGNKLYRAASAGANEITEGEWILVQDEGITTAVNNAATAQSTADGKIVTFFQDSIPTSEGIGDLWIDTNDDNKLYRAASAGADEIKIGEWVLARDAGIESALGYAAQAITDAATAQGTADGKVTTFYQSGIPTSEGIGDLWIDTDDGNKLYRAASAGADQIVAGEWVAIPDEGIASALSSAASAQSTADGKIVTFFQAGIPTSEGIGDLWMDSDDSNKVYRAEIAGANEIKAGEWVLVRDSGIAQALSDAATAIGNAATAQSTADGKVTTFYAATEPTAEAEGDLWIETDNDNRLYRWNGSAWISIQDGQIQSAISAAATAQTTADGKIVTFYSSSPPIAEGIGDLWIDTDDDNKLYRAESIGADQIAAGEWVLVRDSGIADAIAAAATANSIALGKINVFFQDSVPTSTAIGDLWIDTDDNNRLYYALSVGADEIAAGEWVAAPYDVANWNDIYNRPGYTETPSTAGVYVNDSYIGYWNGSAWRVYIRSNGRFYFGDGTRYFSWDGTNFDFRTDGEIRILGGGDLKITGSDTEANRGEIKFYYNGLSTAYFRMYSGSSGYGMYLEPYTTGGYGVILFGSNSNPFQQIRMYSTTGITCFCGSGNAFVINTGYLNVGNGEVRCDYLSIDEAMSAPASISGRINIYSDATGALKTRTSSRIRTLAQIHTGTYSGNTTTAGNTQTIDVGFPIKYVKVWHRAASGAATYAWETSDAAQNYYGYLNSSALYIYQNFIDISGNTFIVVHQASNSPNQSGHTYEYMAIG